MTFLPIVGRELRVAARRGTTHWARFGLTAVVSLITVNYFVSSGPTSPNAIGRSAFVWLLSAAFVLACAACALTADALSAEHREGTLGLLFLTDLRTWDITLGKLASSGLGAAYAGVAFVPLLMLPLLAGGVSGWESVRSGIALLAIGLFSLSAGLAASAREIDRMRALRRAAMRVSGFVLLPPLIAWLGGTPPLEWIGLLSPLTVLRLAQDTSYQGAPVGFWVSLVLQVLHAGWLLTRSGVRLRHTLMEQPPESPGSTRLVAPDTLPPTPEPKPYSADPFSNASYAIANPPHPQRPTSEAWPLEWLVQRQRGQRMACWSAAILMILSSQLGFGSLFLQSIIRVVGTGLPLGYYALYQLGWVADAILAWAACRFLFEARRSGELELLLATPLAARSLVAAHWAAMKRLLVWPMVLVLTLLLLQGGCSAPVFAKASGRTLGTYPLFLTLYPLLRCAQVILTVLAINWVGMFFALTARRLFSAVALTLGWVIGLPMVVHFLLQLAIRMWIEANPGSMSSTLLSWSYYVIDFTILILLTSWARQCFRRGPLAEMMHLDWVEDLKGTWRQFLGFPHAARP